MYFHFFDHTYHLNVFLCNLVANNLCMPLYALLYYMLNKLTVFNDFVVRPFFGKLLEKTHSSGGSPRGKAPFLAFNIWWSTHSPSSTTRLSIPYEISPPLLYLEETNAPISTTFASRQHSTSNSLAPSHTTRQLARLQNAFCSTLFFNFFFYF